MSNIEWQEVPQPHLAKLYRAKVFGGWLVKTVDEVLTPTFLENGRFQRSPEMEWRTSITFVPDINHEWDFNNDCSQKTQQ